MLEWRWTRSDWELILIHNRGDPRYAVYGPRVLGGILEHDDLDCENQAADQGGVFTTNIKAVIRGLYPPHQFGGIRPWRDSLRHT